MTTSALRLLTRGRSSAWLAAAVCVSALVLVWIGYRAVAEWERAASQVAARRADAAADLLVTALSRDMHGAQRLLSEGERDGLAVAKPVDLLHPVAGVFARYPYVEAFFSGGRDVPASSTLLFYSRTDRRPPWMTGEAGARSFPVAVGTQPTLGATLLDRILRDAAQGRRLSVFATAIQEAPYQVVATIAYADPLREHVAGVLGYLVNLQWAERNYFAELTSQIARIEGTDRGVDFGMLDPSGQTRIGADVSGRATPVTRRTFQVAFFDPDAIAVDPPRDLTLATWTAIASTQNDPTLAAAERGARRAVGVAAVMALVLTVGLALSLQAGRASAQLADMRSQFVSAVTHELKTPIANLRAIHETLASGRTTIEMLRDYSQMGVREASRLARLVDNLLAYARITDVADAYAFEDVDVHSVVERTIREFSANLQHGGFHVETDLPEHLPAVRADPTALSLMLNNLVDNAIRYSPATRDLHIAAVARERTVLLTVTDKGIGISADDLPKVTRRFSRGHGTNTGGSGLGLAIVDRIVHDHGGTLTIASQLGEGTTVSIELPIAA